jgi:hypothetical protein
MDVPELARTASPRPRGHRPAPVLPGGAAAPVSSPPPPQPPQSGLFHDAALDDVCRMQTFENQAFATRDFMAAMSERLISRSKADPGREWPACGVASAPAAGGVAWPAVLNGTEHGRCLAAQSMGGAGRRPA